MDTKSKKKEERTATPDHAPGSPYFIVRGVSLSIDVPKMAAQVQDHMNKLRDDHYNVQFQSLETGGFIVLGSLKPVEERAVRLTSRTHLFYAKLSLMVPEAAKTEQNIIKLRDLYEKTVAEATESIGPMDLFEIAAEGMSNLPFHALECTVTECNWVPTVLAVSTLLREQAQARAQ